MDGSGRKALREVVAEEVRAHMGRQRLSAVRLARNTGLSERYLSRRLSAKMPLNLDDMEALASELGVPVLRLFPDALVAERDVPLPRRPESPRPPARPRQSNGPRGRRS